MPIPMIKERTTKHGNRRRPGLVGKRSRHAGYDGSDGYAVAPLEQFEQSRSKSRVARVTLPQQPFFQRHQGALHHIRTDAGTAK